MKRISKKAICLILSAILLLSVSGITIFAAEETTMNITLRIEGINANMFYKTIEVPYTDSLTLKAALKYIDTQESGITISGLDINYISDINGETGGKFGGWDGWLFKVNNVEPAVGIDSTMLKDGDSVVLYYGDPYGIGMQFPVADTSKIADGIIKLTSSDTTYDNNYKPTVTVNPVAGAAVTWYYGDKSAVYTTDAKGEIKINNAQLTSGEHKVQIAKTDKSGIPLVLRFAPDYTVKIASNNTQTGTTAVSAANSTTAAGLTKTTEQTKTAGQTEASSPKTGDRYSALAYAEVLSIAAAGIMLLIKKGRKHCDEK